MTRRWPWHIMGSATAVLLLYVWLGLTVPSVHLPRVSGVAFFLWLFGSAAISVAAGRRGSKWWYLLTICLGLSLALIWIGEFFLEQH